jgi:apolipoprotein N-acyltransferase
MTTLAMERAVRGSEDAHRFLVGLVGLAVVASMVAVGGRWDIALAAWVAPIFLLRIMRISRPPLSRWYPAWKHAFAHYMANL